jgi:hypothetical protein
MKSIKIYLGLNVHKASPLPSLHIAFHGLDYGFRVAGPLRRVAKLELPDRLRGEVRGRIRASRCWLADDVECPSRGRIVIGPGGARLDCANQRPGALGRRVGKCSGPQHFVD